MTYLAIDPGITSGWAFFDDNGQNSFFPPNDFGLGQVTGLDTFVHFLDNIPRDAVPDVIIYENYRVNDKAINWGQEIETIQVIGMIKYYAILNNCKLVKQEPRIKQMGYRYLGKTPPKNHKYSHHMDALVHGEYYLVTNKIKKVAL